MAFETEDIESEEIETEDIEQLESDDLYFNDVLAGFTFCITKRTKQKQSCLYFCSTVM